MIEAALERLVGWVKDLTRRVERLEAVETQAPVGLSFRKHRGSRQPPGMVTHAARRRRQRSTCRRYSGRQPTSMPYCYG